MSDAKATQAGALPSGPGAADGYVGQADFADAGTDAGGISFLARSLMARMQTAMLVQVQAVASPGGLGPVGMVDVLPMVSQIDGAGNATPHATIHNVPYLRLQGGRNAVVIDPEPGDIGIAVFSSRDHSKVKATRKPGPPGSRRRHDAADALYLGGVLNQAPEQFIQFTAAGITLTSPVAVTINAPSVTVNAPTVAVNGDLGVVGKVTANGQDIGSTHKHTGVQTGGGVSGIPV